MLQLEPLFVDQQYSLPGCWFVPRVCVRQTFLRLNQSQGPWFRLQWFSNPFLLQQQFQSTLCPSSQISRSLSPTRCLPLALNPPGWQMNLMMEEDRRKPATMALEPMQQQLLVKVELRCSYTYLKPVTWYRTAMTCSLQVVRLVREMATMHLVPLYH